MDTKYHDLSCIALSIPSFAAAYFLHEPSVILIGVGSLAGLLMSPDLDWDGNLVFNSRTNSTYIVTRRAAIQEHVRRRVFSKISRRWPAPFRQWWAVYAIVFSHRKLSHFPFFGTLTRLLWLFPFFIPAIYFLPIYSCEFISGLVLVDILHWLLDGRP